MPFSMLSSSDSQPAAAVTAAAAATADSVFERLSEMFGDAVNADVILNVGNRMAWNREYCS